MIVVEDVVDTGLTLNFLARTLSLREPASLSAVTLLDRPYRRLVDDVPLDYVGFTVPDELFAGYGLGLDERWRALPDLHFVAIEELPSHLTGDSYRKLRGGVGPERLEVAERVDWRTVDPDLEVDVRACRVARISGVGDQLALGDGLADADRHARVVPVGGGEAVAVVDDDEVAVAAQPAGDDHRSRTRRRPPESPSRLQDRSLRACGPTASRSRS